MSDRETTSESRPRVNNSNDSSGRSATTGTTPGTATGWDAVIQHISRNKIDFILAITRALTVLCTISYLIGIPSPASRRFKQALLLGAATSFLRLHQRVPPPPLSQLDRLYVTNLFKEDSLHYLIFPLMFFSGPPLSLTLLPGSLYALFNIAVYSISMLDKLGNQETLKVQISNLVVKYQQSLLHTIAMSEIAMMPVVIIGVFFGATSVLAPIMYYNFLKLRYDSSRNAHFKLLVWKIKTHAMNYASRYMNR